MHAYVKPKPSDYVLERHHGSNRVLRAMNRGYAIEDFIEAVTAIKNTRKDFEIRTQLMVGFTGETNSDFGDTLASREQTGKYLNRIGLDFDKFFPRKPVTQSKYQWAARKPADFRDVFSPDIMPEGPWDFPIEIIERIQADGLGDAGGDSSRHSKQMSLLWLMPFIEHHFPE